MFANYFTFVLCSYASWCILYRQAFKLERRKFFRVDGKGTKAEFYCRLVTLIHAIGITILSISSIFISRTWPYREPAGPNSLFQEIIFILSVGYFLFDLHWCLHYKYQDAFMIFHHLVSISAFATSLYKGIYGDEIVAALFATEVTNPILQIRWFMLNVSINKTPISKVTKSQQNNSHNISRRSSDSDFEFIDKKEVLDLKENRDATGVPSSSSDVPEKNKETTKAPGNTTQQKKIRLCILVADLTFFFLFTLMRIILGSMYFIEYQNNSQPDFLGRLGLSAIYVVSLVFWVQIISYLFKTYLKRT